MAPFYYDWPVDLTFLSKGVSAEPVILQEKISEILPGETVEWRVKRPISASGFQLRIPNPMAGGMPIRFANTESDGEKLTIQSMFP